MGRHVTLESIILKTHDVGDADRYCILFTKEKGKIAARARGVRKPKSKMGGCLLQLRHVHVSAQEHSSGWHIGDAQVLSEWSSTDIDVFLRMQQGTELLISLLQDEEALPELFHATIRFFDLCEEKNPNAVAAFTLQLLNILGLLPHEDDAYFHLCDDSQKQFIRKSAEGKWQELPDISDPQKKQFSALLAPLIAQLSSAPLKSGAVIGDMLAGTTVLSHAGAAPASEEAHRRQAPLSL